MELNVYRFEVAVESAGELLQVIIPFPREPEAFRDFDLDGYVKELLERAVQAAVREHWPNLSGRPWVTLRKVPMSEDDYARLGKAGSARDA